jgi:hypothetical protein
MASGSQFTPTPDAAAITAAIATISGKADKTELNLRGVVPAGLAADLNEGTLAGTDDSAAIQAAIDGGARTIIIPAPCLIASTIVLPEKVDFVGLGKVAVRMHYTGSGIAVTMKNTVSPGSRDSGHIRNFYFTATSAAAGLVQISNIFRCAVHDCRFADVPNGFGLQLLNAVGWTEGFRGENCEFVNCGIAIDGAITTGTDSFAETTLRDFTIIPSAPGQRVFRAAATADFYFGDITLKVTHDVPPAATPTDDPVVILELGAGAKIRDGLLRVFSESPNNDRYYTRLKAGAGAYVSGFGYVKCAEAGGMLDLVGATHLYDDMHATAAFYIEPDGTLMPGMGGPARIGAGRPHGAKKSIESSGEVAVLYTFAEMVEVTIIYRGPSRRHAVTLLMSSGQYANAGASSNDLVILCEAVFISQPVWDSEDISIKFSDDGNPFLCVPVDNAVAGGTLSVTYVIKCDVNSGSTLDFGALKPTVPLPSLSGITLGAAIITARRP